MKTDAVIKQEGFSALLERLNMVETERFITLVKRGNFDYTKWRKNLWEDLSVEKLSKDATEFLKKKGIK